MNHLLYNISVIIIIVGIIFLTNSLSNINCTNNYYKKINKVNRYKSSIIKDYPSKVFSKMFDSPSVWMGYSDSDSKEFELSKKID
tara:strand:+ start:3590 stop:3844 length:255 start_codon:yes stop_codon:yes gene_type:complete